MNPSCRKCGSVDLKELGWLGDMYWTRCRACGYDNGFRADVLDENARAQFQNGPDSEFQE